MASQGQAASLLLHDRRSAPEPPASWKLGPAVPTACNGSEGDVPHTESWHWTDAPLFDARTGRGGSHLIWAV